MSMDIIERGIELWSNPGDVVFDPFGGIGSTTYCAVNMRRKGIMTELKPSYFEMAVNNLRNPKTYIDNETYQIFQSFVESENCTLLW